MTKNIKKITLISLAIILIASMVLAGMLFPSNNKSNVGSDVMLSNVAKGGATVGANGVVEPNYQPRTGAVAISNGTELTNFLNSAQEGNTVTKYGYLTNNISNYVYYGRSNTNAQFNKNQVRNIELDGCGFSIQLVAQYNTSPSVGSMDWAASDLNSTEYQETKHFAGGESVVIAGGFIGALNQSTVKNINFVFDGYYRYAKTGTNELTSSYAVGAVFGYVANSTVDNCSLTMNGSLYTSGGNSHERNHSGASTSLVGGFAAALAKSTISNSLIDMGDYVAQGQVNDGHAIKMFALRAGKWRVIANVYGRVRSYVGGVSAILNDDARVFNITTAGKAGLQAGVNEAAGDGGGFRVAAAGVVVGCNTNDPYLNGGSMGTDTGLINLSGAGRVDGVVNSWTGIAAWNVSRWSTIDAKYIAREHYVIRGCVVGYTGHMTLNANGTINTSADNSNNDPLLTGVYYTFDPVSEAMRVKSSGSPEWRFYSKNAYSEGGYLGVYSHEATPGGTTGQPHGKTGPNDTETCAYGFSPIGSSPIVGIKPSMSNQASGNYDDTTKVMIANMPYSVVGASTYDNNGVEEKFVGTNNQLGKTVVKFDSQLASANIVVEFIPSNNNNMIWKYDIVDSNNVSNSQSVSIVNTHNSISDIVDSSNLFNGKQAFRQTYSKTVSAKAEQNIIYKFQAGKVVTYDIADANNGSTYVNSGKATTIPDKEYDKTALLPNLRLYFDADKTVFYTDYQNANIWKASRESDFGTYYSLDSTKNVALNNQNQVVSWKMYVWNNDVNSKYEFRDDTLRMVSYRADRDNVQNNEPTEYAIQKVTQKETEVSWSYVEEVGTFPNSPNLSNNKYQYCANNVPWKAGFVGNNILLGDSCLAELTYFVTIDDGVTWTQLSGAPKNVGKYSVKVVSLSNLNYVNTNDLYYEFEITKGKISIDQGSRPSSYAYDGAEHKVGVLLGQTRKSDAESRLNVQAYGIYNADPATAVRVVYSTDNFVNAGVYTITLEIVDTNYEFTNPNAAVTTITINKGNVIISNTSADSNKNFPNKVYDRQVFVFGNFVYQGVGADVIEPEPLNIYKWNSTISAYEPTYTEYVNAAGKYKVVVEVSNENNNNYNDKTEEYYFEIDKRVVSIKGNSTTATMIYGDSVPNLSGIWSYVDGSNHFIPADNIVVNLSTTATSSSIVGSYPVIIGNVEGNKDNYDIQLQSGASIQITHREVDFDFVVNGANINNQYEYKADYWTATSLYEFEGFEIVYTYAVGNTLGMKNVGTYNVNATLSTIASNKFVLSSNSTTQKTFQVVAKDITIDITKAKVGYGSAFVSSAIEFGYEQGKAPFSVDLSVINNNIIFATNRTLYSNVGNYDLTVQNNPALSNYNISINKGLQVVPAELTIGSITANSNLIYDNSAKDVTVTLNGIMGSDIVNADIEYYLNGNKIDSAINVGNYIAKVVGCDNDNYTINLTGNEQSFAIQKRIVSIKLGDYTRAYGSVVISPTGALFSYVSGSLELIENDFIQIELVDKSQASDIGDLTNVINAKLLGDNKDNYTLIVAVEGNLKIIGLDVSTLTLKNPQVTYNGNDWLANIEFNNVSQDFASIVNDALQAKLNGNVVTSIVNAGVYTISIVGDDEKLMGSAQLELVVSKADRNISSNDFVVKVNYNKLTITGVSNAKYSVDKSVWSSSSVAVSSETAYELYAFIEADNNHNASQVVKLGDFTTGFNVDTINTALNSIGDQFKLADLATLSNIETMLTKVDSDDMQFVNATKLSAVREGKQNLTKATQSTVSDAQQIASKAIGKTAKGVATTATVLAVAGVALVISRKRFLV